MRAYRPWRGLAIGVVLGIALLAVFLAPQWHSRSRVVPVQEEAGHEQLRLKMVDEQIASRGIGDERVLAAMRTVPRHEFVPAQYLSQAYEDHPLAIGYGQTISQPYIVALMTDLLDLSPGERVLEIGTGSGYQAAVLAQITPHVYSIEIVPELCEQARSRLGDSVKVICGDGYYGWPDDAPYDAIIVTCAPDHIPQPLVGQLADGGRLVIPVGPPGMYQVLWLLERSGETITSREIGGVSFVPLLRAAR